MHPDKKREIEHELRHEDEANRKETAKPKMTGMFFYDIKPGQEKDAGAYAIKQTKSGKWAMTFYDKSGRSANFRKAEADRLFGPGKWWQPKSTTNEDAPTVGTITQVTDKDVSFKDASGIETKVPTTSGLLSKDDTGKLTFNKAAALANHQQSTGGSPPSSTSQPPQKLAQTGQQVQINNSVSEELAKIRKNAGLR